MIKTEMTSKTSKKKKNKIIRRMKETTRIATQRKKN